MNKISITILTLLFALFFQSCGVITKTYKHQDPYTFEAYRTNIASTDTNQLANYNWRNLFSDPILINYIDTALKNNLDVLKAEENIEIAQAYLKQSKAAFAPSIGLEGQYNLSTPTMATFMGRFVTDRMRVDDIKLDGFFNWEIDVWGKIRSQRNASKATYLQAENAERYVKTQLIANVASTYFALLALDKKREVLLDNIKNRQEGVETSQALKDAGNTTEVAVQQNKALLLNAQGMLVDIENSIKVRENMFSILLGMVPQEIERSNLDLQKITTDFNLGVPIELLSNRPDVLASEYNLISAFEMTNVARASFYPSLSISGMLGLNSRNFSDLFSLNALFANILGNITQPLFNQRKLRTIKEVRESEQEIALLDYKSSVLDAYREVNDAIFNYNANQNKYFYKVQENNALQKAISYSEELQTQGMASYLEVIIAKNNALSTELDMVDIELNQSLNIIELYRALGGGWK
ncbi:MAG: efflux transporter outer membrane subunit [Bacteroidetes bacterium]|nr:efflux transporter outer membrane subunit [Bacteroidota bacterium]MCB9227934.1 efflux transporter outer membrane subunit [Chitinophagales bacterium]